MIAIPNMEKPERCTHCIAFTLQEAPTHYAYDELPYVYPYCELLEREIDDDEIPNDCPLIEIVTCGECKHRPIKDDPNGADYGFNIVEPNDGDDICPCLVEDGWYSWMPEDNFYCGRGERRNDDI